MLKHPQVGFWPISKTSLFSLLQLSHLSQLSQPGLKLPHGLFLRGSLQDPRASILPLLPVVHHKDPENQQGQEQVRACRARLSSGKSRNAELEQFEVLRFHLVPQK